MNTYYKLSLLYFMIGTVFLIVGFYVTRDISGLKDFYDRPHIVTDKDNDNAPESGEIA